MQTELAEKIVNLGNIIEHDLPHTNIVISELLGLIGMNLSTPKLLKWTKNYAVFVDPAAGDLFHTLSLITAA